MVGWMESDSQNATSDVNITQRSMTNQISLKVKDLNLWIHPAIFVAFSVVQIKLVKKVAKTNRLCKN